MAWMQSVVNGTRLWVQPGRCSVNVDWSRILSEFARLLKELRIGEEEGICTTHIFMLHCNCSWTIIYQDMLLYHRSLDAQITKLCQSFRVCLESVPVGKGFCFLTQDSDFERDKGKCKWLLESICQNNGQVFNKWCTLLVHIDIYTFLEEDRKGVLNSQLWNAPEDDLVIFLTQLYSNGWIQWGIQVFLKVLIL